jgi:hypothetical protein
VLGEVARGEYPAEWGALALDRLHACGGNAGDAHRRVAQQAARNGGMRDAALAVPLVGTGDNEVRLLLARNLDQPRVGPTDAWFDANAGDALPQQGAHPFR